DDGCKCVLAGSPDNSRRILTEVVTGQSRGNHPQDSRHDVQNRKTRCGHPHGAACRWNDNPETEQEPAHQKEPVVSPRDPINESSINGLLRKASFKPSAATHARGSVVELRTHGIRGERNESYSRYVEI